MFTQQTEEMMREEEFVVRTFSTLSDTPILLLVAKYKTLQIRLVVCSFRKHRLPITKVKTLGSTFIVISVVL